MGVPSPCGSPERGASRRGRVMAMLQLSDEVLARIHAHGEEAYPEEGVTDVDEVASAERNRVRGPGRTHSPDRREHAGLHGVR